MEVSFGRVVVLVRDYEEALAFYRDALGLHVLADVREGPQRFVHLGTGAADGPGVWLLQAQTDAQRSRIGAQTAGAPMLVLYTDDCAGARAALLAHGVRCGAVEGTAEHESVHVEDPYGNLIILVTLKA